MNLLDIFCCKFLGNEIKIGMSKGIVEFKLMVVDVMLDKFIIVFFIC